MTLRRWGVRILELTIILTVVSLIAGSILGQPILLSYVETGSMEPTIEPGDGFIAVPTEMAGPVEIDDVVVFEAEKIQGGGLTTHRVVGKNDRGFVTKGDANSFTDQADEEPPVKRVQVVAKAAQFGETIIVIPHLGTVIEGIQSTISTAQRQLAIYLGTKFLLGAQGLAYIFFGASLLWYLVGAWRGDNRRETHRTVSRATGQDTRVIVGAFTILLVLGATTAMVAPASTHEFSVVSSEYESDNPTVIPPGESSQLTYRVPNGGLLPIVAFLEPMSDEIEVHPHEIRVKGHDIVNATITLNAPPETGNYRRFLVEDRYLALLPMSTIRTLHSVHPWVPILAIDVLIGVPFYVLGVAMVGGSRIRHRSRDREFPLFGRVIRIVRSFY